MTYRQVILSAASMLAFAGWGQPGWARAETTPSTEAGIEGAAAQDAGDFARAAELYQHACAIGDGAACALLGSMHTRRDQGVKLDGNLALIFFGLGCDAGNAVACDAAKQLEAAHGSTEQEEAESSAIAAAEAAVEEAAEPEADPSDPVPITFADMQKGCDDGVAIDCLTLGHMYRDGNGVSQDNNRAVAMYRTACDISQSDDQFGSYACHFAAAAYESGDGVPQDIARALQLYEKSCKAGNDDSCSQATVVRLATGKS